MRLAKAPGSRASESADLAIIDDASRFCLGGRWIASKAEPAELGALAAVLERWGMPEAMLTDRASVFYGPATRQAGLTTYQLALDSLGVRAAFCAPHKPRTKGKVEKFIQTVQHEFLWELAAPPGKPAAAKPVVGAVAAAL